jgi:putative SOS response-associated peptidase YedK
MCGRYVLKTSMRQLQRIYGIPDDDTSRSEEWRPRYNLAPSQDAPVVRVLAGQRRLDLLRWGLLPGWATDPTLALKLINARSETVATKPAFRGAFRSRRCIVPADGFYEWQAGPSGKQPFYIHAADDSVLSLAGLWETWRSPGGEVLETYAILTTEANAWMRPLHDRMPVILLGEAVDQWLDPASSAGALQSLLKAPPEVSLKAYPVSRAVGAVKNDSAELIEPQS